MTGDRQFILPASDSDMPKTGGVHMIDLGNGKGRVWTKRIGLPDNKINLLLLHGGPGCDHTYMQCFEDYMLPNNVTIYHYDQLECGLSDKPHKTELWTTEEYTDHVEIVRKALGLGASGNEQGKIWYLLGHSWGGMLAMEYAIKYSANVTGVIVSNMTPDSKSVDDYSENVLRPQLPPHIEKRMREIEATKDWDSTEYHDLVETYWNREHLVRLSQDVVDSIQPIKQMEKQMNTEMYRTMQGPNEMVSSGTLMDWTCVDRLHKITCRTLYVTAKYDTMDPQAMKHAAELTPGSEYWCSETGSHSTMYDDQINYMTRILEFIVPQ